MATPGYLWVEGRWVNYINQTTAVKTEWHTDTAHSDWPNSIAHSNLAHSDVAHSDVAYGDWHDHSDKPGCFLAGTKISMANSSSKK